MTTDLGARRALANEIYENILSMARPSTRIMDDTGIGMGVVMHTDDDGESFLSLLVPFGEGYYVVNPRTMPEYHSRLKRLDLMDVGETGHQSVFVSLIETNLKTLDARIEGRCPLGWSSGDADELWVPPYGNAEGYGDQLARIADRMRTFLNNYKRMRAELDPKNPDSPLNAIGARAGGWNEAITRLFFEYMTR